MINHIEQYDIEQYEQKNVRSIKPVAIYPKDYISCYATNREEVSNFIDYSQNYRMNLQKVVLR